MAQTKLTSLFCVNIYSLQIEFNEIYIKIIPQCNVTIPIVLKLICVVYILLHIIQFWSKFLRVTGIQAIPPYLPTIR